MIYLLIASPFSYGQESPYKLREEIDSVLLNDTTRWKYEIAAWDYSFIGEYAKAIITYELADKRKTPDSSKTERANLTKQASAILAPYKPAPAKEYILRKAKETRLVIINEAHHNSRHRSFVEELLPELSRLGYTFLGIETLNHIDTLLTKRKYPVVGSGFYSREPCFGNMIRSALRADYMLFPYETKLDVDGKEREIDQAINAKKVMDEHPNAKFIIYCGYGHAKEDSLRNGWGFAMAGRLKRLTGIDPLTIDQVELTEGGDQDHFMRSAASNINYPAVFVDSNGNAYNKAAASGSYDANVFHPDTKYKYGRPDWLQLKNREPVAITSKIRIDFPCLVLAYVKGENMEEAIPVDVIQLQNKRDRKRLILPKNQQYLIVVKNIKGERQTIRLCYERPPRLAQ